MELEISQKAGSGRIRGSAGDRELAGRGDPRSKILSRARVSACMDPGEVLAWAHRRQLTIDGNDDRRPARGEGGRRGAGPGFHTIGEIGLRKIGEGESMRWSVVLLLVALLSFVPVAVCIGHEAADDAKGSGVVGETILDDWSADINFTSGLVWNVERQDWQGYVNWPFGRYKQVDGVVGFEYDPETVDRGPTAVLVGLTVFLGSLRDVGLDVSWADYFGCNIGPVLRYDLLTGDKELAVVMSVVDISIGEKRKR